MITFTKLDKEVMVETTFKRYNRDMRMKSGSKLMLKNLLAQKTATEARIVQLQANVVELQSTIDEIKNNDDVKALTEK